MCKYCNGWKKQQLFKDLYAGIAMDVKKTNNYYETYMCILQMALWKL